MGFFFAMVAACVGASIAFMAIGSCFASLKWHLGNNVEKHPVGLRRKVRKVITKFLCPFSVAWEKDERWIGYRVANTEDHGMSDYVLGGRTAIFWPIYLLMAVVYGTLYGLYHCALKPLCVIIFWVITKFAPLVGKKMASS